jgi:DivIVA domain-containing protein
MRLTPDDVRNAKFRSVRRGKRGYDEHEVDVFLDRVEATLRGEDTLTADDVLAAKFRPRQRRKLAYVDKDVDAFLDKVAKELRRGDTRGPRRAKARSAPPQRSTDPPAPPQRPVDPPAPPQRPVDPPAPPQRPTDHPTPPAAPQVRNVSFPGAGPQEPAYDAAEVDVFVERVEATLRGEDTLTAQDLLTVRFSPARPGGRGCQKSGVDAFLMQVALSLKQLTARPRTPVRSHYARNPAATPHLPRPASTAPRLNADDLRNITFSCPPPGQPAYDPSEVDAFLDRVEATLRGRGTLTVKEVAMVTFRSPAPGRSGYDEGEVEALLDLIEERLTPTAAAHGA